MTRKEYLEYMDLERRIPEFTEEFGAAFTEMSEESRYGFIDYRTNYNPDMLPGKPFLEIYEGFWNGDKTAFAEKMAYDMGASDIYGDEDAVEEFKETLFCHEYEMSDYGFVFRYR